jgi:hypothetical protein
MRIFTEILNVELLEHPLRETNQQIDNFKISDYISSHLIHY